MIVTRLLEQVDLKRHRGLVVAVGGSADIILAKCIAEGLIKQGCSRVDLAQPLNCRTLSEKGLLTQAGEVYALGPEQGLDPEGVLRHFANVPSENHLDSRRGKGLSISSSLEWNHGDRYVCAAHGDGLSLLAAREDGQESFYDFAVAVDGGGDVLTHGDEEFDRVVLSAFLSGWNPADPLVLVAMGLGADGASSPAEFRDVSMVGWKRPVSATVDGKFAQFLQRDLERLGLWHPDPSNWTKDDPYWGYGLKVPQIIALTVQGVFPFAGTVNDPDLVMFPRRRELKLMDRRLLCEARMFLWEGAR